MGNAIRLLFAALLVISSGGILAQTDYPAKPVSMVVGFPPEGTA